MDFYTAEKLVGYKQAELRAEAAQAARDAAWAGERLDSIGALSPAARLLRGWAKHVWNGRVKRAPALSAANR